MAITCSTKVDQLFLSTGAGLNHFLLTRPVAFGNDIALHLTLIRHSLYILFLILLIFLWAARPDTVLLLLLPPPKFILLTVPVPSSLSLTVLVVPDEWPFLIPPRVTVA